MCWGLSVSREVTPKVERRWNRKRKSLWWNVKKKLFFCHGRLGQDEECVGLYSAVQLFTPAQRSESEPHKYSILDRLTWKDTLTKLDLGGEHTQTGPGRGRGRRTSHANNWCSCQLHRRHSPTRTDVSTGVTHSASPPVFVGLFF